MRTYYTQKNAQHYNRTWRSFLEKTLAATISLIEMTHLDEETDKRARPIRILDAACGTGLLLAQLARLMPRAELYGVDASQAMLTQAADLLRDCPHVHLIQASIADGETAGLPFAAPFFYLITCTHTPPYFSAPLAALPGFWGLLVFTGPVVVEGYVMAGVPVPRTR